MRHVLTLILVLLLTVACGASDLTREEAARIAKLRFPGAKVIVEGVRSTDSGRVAKVTLNGNEVDLEFSLYDSGWMIDAVVAGGDRLSPEVVARLAARRVVIIIDVARTDAGKAKATIMGMRGVAVGLGTYRVDEGEYPKRLAFLLPDYLGELPASAPWGRLLEYEQTDAGKGFALTAPGADGAIGTPDDLVMINSQFTELPPGVATLSLPISMLDTRRFDILATYSRQQSTLTGRGQPERLTGVSVPERLFPMLGVEPILGRTFLHGERTVLLAHRAWQRYFDGDPAVIGARVQLDEIVYTVVGVMPSGFAFPDHASDFWTPFDHELIELER